MADRWLYAWGLGSVSFGGASLLVPLYVVQLGGTPVDLGILFASATAIGAPGAILFGRFADHVGHRRTLVLLTLAVVAGTLLLMPLLDRVHPIYVVNAALWFVVAAASPVVTMVLVADAASDTWATRIGQLNTYQGYGWAGGLVLGTLWPVVGRPFLGAETATRALFWLLALCAAGAALLAARNLPRPVHGEHVTNERARRRIGRLLAATGSGVKGATFAFMPNRLYWTTRGFRPRQLGRRLDPSMATYLLAAALFFVGFAAFWAPLPLFFSAVGFTPGQIFGLYLASSVASAALYGGAGRLASRYDLRLLQAGALALRGLLFPVTALGAGIGALTLGFGVMGVLLAGIGGTWAVIAVVGTAIVTRLAPASVRGEFLGIHTAMAAVAGGIGGILGGWIATAGYLVAFAVAGGLVVVGAALVVTLTALSGSRRLSAPADEPVVEAPTPVPTVADRGTEPVDDA
ncbi:MAG: MFS transporter [Halobacteriales archaeon]